MRAKTAILSIPFFLTVFVCLLIINMIIWAVFVDGKLYYCSDSAPVIDFIPPFVHGQQYGDYYIAPSQLVWGIWYGLNGGSLLIAFLLARNARRKLTSRP